jgi:transglutaminase-like putative cysteine protease
MKAPPASMQPRRRRDAASLALRRFALALVQPQMSSAARERRDVLVLLLAISFVVAPHFEHLAWWAIATFVALWSWRFWLTAAQRSAPGHLAMLPLLIAAAVAVWLEHRTLLGRDAGVTFLLLLIALKLLELRARRDIFVVIFLAFFILLTQFLFDQGLPVALMTVAAVVLLFFVLVSVNLTDNDLPAQQKLRLVSVIVLKAIPLTAVLFVLFPRLSEPLWGLPSDAYSGTTGLSNSMSPGTISRLLESDQIAFRVRFASAPPANHLLYWRGPVFGLFTGRTWGPLSERLVSPPPLSAQADPASAADYTVTLEPNQRDWLFALDLPLTAPAHEELRPRLNSEGQLLAGRLVTQRVRYAMRSYTRYAMGLNESELSLRDWAALPAGFNPRTLQWATELRRRTPAAETRAGDVNLINAVLDHFRRDGFVYTLKPPLLGRHSIDEFMFDTRQGYCEHYAAAFVVLMRALDIPARVVTGYQGGEINPVDDFMTVRQSDAHAWAEVWLAERGWTRVDPTAVVAPVRIEQGAVEIARQAGLNPGYAGAAGAGAPTWIRWLRAVRFNWEAMQNSWNQWVLAYSPERQRALLERLGLEPDWRTLGVLLAISFCVILSVLAYFSLRYRNTRDPLAQLFDRFRNRLLDAGVRVDLSLGPRALRLQIDNLLAPTARRDAAAILQAIERWRYSRASDRVTAAQLRALRRAVRRFRPTLV